MTTYPPEIQFKFPWRKYQQRVLDELENYLADGHLHIIAPPGSGKTVLGLEVARRINKPTLILAPTIAIRNQWIQRFCALFLQAHPAPDWITTDIRNPRFMTVATYQGLHAACNNLNWAETEAEEEEETEAEEREIRKPANRNLEQIVSGLKAQGLGTIVVDEAHHLKNEWWQTLTKVKEKLEPVIVGLTATPPYDVTPVEWQRYLELNGPVDAEIAAPDLVIEGDLCPHQDYIHFSAPTAVEFQAISDFRKNMDRLFWEIKLDETLAEAIENHPIWLNPQDHLEWIYNNLSCYTASLIFLNASEREIPRLHLEVVGDEIRHIPELDYHWMELLLDFYLYQEKTHFGRFAEHRKKLEERLRRSGALENRQISFTQNKKINGLLTSSISKLGAIQEITEFEYQILGSRLRLVILSDFIRKEYFTQSPGDMSGLLKMGVMPIFEKLRRENHSGKKIGVLTGSLIILPHSALPALHQRALKYGITGIDTTPVAHDPDYMVIRQKQQGGHDLIHLVTQLFQRGEIEVLIGTKSLLGEGWDAPAINALILASFVGSFVLSNQMRGRAIRTEPGNIDKTGNIWHLACVDPTLPDNGDDFGLLKRRFRSFVGISCWGEPRIENGIGRLGISETVRYERDRETQNRETFEWAGDRATLKQRWASALETGITLVEEITIPFTKARRYRTVKNLYLYKTIAYLLFTLTSGLMTFGEATLRSLARLLRNVHTWEDLYARLAVLFGVVTLLFGGLAWRTLRLYIQYRDIAKDIGQIGIALLDALEEAGVIQTKRANLEVRSVLHETGAVFCHLHGGSTIEKSTFIQALLEIVGPVDNPRYVIIRKSRFLFFVTQRDYHSVPELIGRNKPLAAFFESRWNSLVGECELVFTRSLAGRKLLLKARIRSLAAQFEKRASRLNKWQ